MNPSPLSQVPFRNWLAIALLLVAGPLFGREPGIRMVRNINKTPGGFSRAIHWIQPAGEKVVFNAYSSKEGNELWVSNGTKRGTKLLKDIRPGSDGSLSYATVSMDGVAYFAANDGVHGYELWRSDGTANGTHMVADAVPGPEFGPATPAFAHNGVIYLSEATLWTSDGSGAAYTALNPPGSHHGGATLRGCTGFLFQSANPPIS